jgi:PKD repeat protein
MWVIGGISDGSLKNDVWYSSDGIIWKLATPAAAFTARSGHTSVVYDNKMWVIGGHDGGYKNDVWYSSDGITWNPATAAAAFPARQSHTSLNATNKMWVIGGYDGGTMNDVWYSSDGITWNQATAGAAFPALYYHTSVEYDDRMWVIGGLDNVGTIFNDAWYSSDGVTWTAATVTTSMPQREGHTSVVSGSKMWLLGGFDGANTNSTWSFTSSPVAAFTANRTYGNPPLTVTFTDTSSGYPATYAWTFGDGDTSTAANPVHTYAAAGTYPVSLTVTNSDGTDTETKAGYIIVTNPPPPDIDDERPPAYPGAPQQPVTVTVNVGGDTAVSRATVTGTGLADLIVTGTVRPAPGSGIPPAPGIIYQYLDLVPARYTTITGSELSFAIPAVWLGEHGAGAETVALWHYTGSAWERRPTSLTKTANGQVEYSAEVTGFSLFAIVAEKDGLPAKPDVRTSPIDEIPLADGDIPAPGVPVAAPPISPPPQGEPVRGSPFGTPAILAVCGIVLISGGLLVRRWWIRRQNPALFRKYP